jgi:mRNA-degrading endonuclease RelE of RelBE toxin-antitoxin system
MLILDIAPTAAKGLAAIPDKERAALQHKIRQFAIDPLTPRKWATQLVGEQYFRIKQGKYRAKVHRDFVAKKLIVTDVGPRKDVYDR